MKKFFSLVLLLSAFLIGCAVSEHRALEQPVGETLTASVGSTLVRLNKKGDMPNAFGGADIYGRKIDKGFAEVKLYKIRGNGVVDLLVYDVFKDSSATTMDGYGKPISINQSVTIGNDAPSGVPVTVDTKTDKTFVVSGVKITFLEVGASYVRYSLTDLKK